MKINKKINAFTLSEMLVVLVISSIVVSLTFLSLSMVQKQIKSIQNNIEIKQEVQFIERLLWQDFNKYSLRFNQFTNSLLLKNSVDSLSYTFNDNYLIRKKDTLPIEIITKKLFLDGEEVISGALDAMQLETSPVFGDTKLFIYKTKDASFYLNN